jgi:predicted transcriptional regulator of viral defense system
MSTTAPLTTRAIEPNGIYSVAEAAQLTPLARKTLRKYLRLGKLKGKGRPYRIKGSELLKLA